MQQAPSETQLAVRDVVRGLFDRAGDTDEATWSTLADAGLLGLAVPETLGGEGLGLGELGEVLTEIGRRRALLPVWETLVCAALTVARCGTEEQQARVLTGLATGERRATAALAEPGAAVPRRPATTLTRRGSGWRLTGRVVGVGGLDGAATVLVPATVTTAPDRTSAPGTVVVLLDPGAPGARAVATHSSRGVPEHTLVLDDVAVADSDVLGGAPGSPDAARAPEVLRQHAIAGLCLLGHGLLLGATELTAAYVTERRQFGRALAEFQAVAMQLADVYVATRTVGLTADAAAWRVAERLPADDDLAVAAHWFAVEGPAALHTCHHVHGGTGVDI